MQPCVAIVGKRPSVNPVTLTNRFSSIHQDHNLTYETMRQHQAKKTFGCRDIGGDDDYRLMNAPVRYWDLRKEVSLHNAQSQWTTSQQSNLCTQPSWPWISGRELGDRDERQESSAGTVIGKPVGVALTRQTVRLGPAERRDARAVEPALHLMNPDALRLAQSLGSSEGEMVFGFGGGGGGGGGGSGNAMEQAFSVWKSARTRMGGILGVLALSALAIMLIFSILYWISKSIDLYVPNATFGILDYFWFSVRSFVTMSSPDLGPVNSVGRMLANAEGLLGLITVIILSYFVGEKLKHLLGEE